ncbi:MAG: hypothetical protein HYT79_03650 [Elusimicrobia bacterium]|nr:hypothetical protein [Elusimicrobiota bacterium]
MRIFLALFLVGVGSAANAMDDCEIHPGRTADFPAEFSVCWVYPRYPAKAQVGDARTIGMLRDPRTYRFPGAGNVVMQGPISGVLLYPWVYRMTLMAHRGKLYALLDPMRERREALKELRKQLEQAGDAWTQRHETIERMNSDDTWWIVRGKKGRYWFERTNWQTLENADANASKSKEPVPPDEPQASPQDITWIREADKEDLVEYLGEFEPRVRIEGRAVTRAGAIPLSGEAQAVVDELNNRFQEEASVELRARIEANPTPEGRCDVHCYHPERGDFDNDEIYLFALTERDWESIMENCRGAVLAGSFCQGAH